VYQKINIRKIKWGIIKRIHMQNAYVYVKF
jgi:hypothetical protein